MRRIAVVLAFAGCGPSADEQARIDAVLGLEPDATAGAVVYADECERCHGPDGTGPIGKDLTVYVPDHDDETIVLRILRGPEDMPSFETLEDQQLADVLEHIHGL